MSDARDGCDCSRLHKEVAALELLVGRYQQELTATASCGACGRRANESLLAEVEELFEHQRMNALQWDHTDGADGAMPRFTKRSGQESEFDQILLPSREWTWTSGWHVDVNSKTDANGWTYATSVEDLATEIHCNSDRMIEHRVRRRRWTRERKFVGSTDLPQSVTSSLENEAYLCALQNANKKLTEQLQRANDQLIEYGERIRMYEAKLEEAQSLKQETERPRKPSRILSTLPNGRRPTEFSPRRSREVLSETEALLTQILETAPTVLDEQTRDAQRRRSQMVIECHSELDSAVREFQSMVQTLEDPRRTSH